jgi:hypothetical protein
MNLERRIARLENTLASHGCTCPDSAELSWPGNPIPPNCNNCGGQRIVYPLRQHPRQLEAVIRAGLPLIAKACADSPRADLSRLTDHELHVLRTALQAAEGLATTTVRP